MLIDLIWAAPPVLLVAATAAYAAALLQVMAWDVTRLRWHREFDGWRTILRDRVRQRRGTDHADHRRLRLLRVPPLAPHLRLGLAPRTARPHRRTALGWCVPVAGQDARPVPLARGSAGEAGMIPPAGSSPALSPYAPSPGAPKLTLQEEVYMSQQKIEATVLQTSAVGADPAHPGA